MTYQHISEAGTLLAAEEEEEEGEEAVQELMMEGPSSESRAPKANGEVHSAVEIPETAHQISKGLLIHLFFLFPLFGC